MGRFLRPLSLIALPLIGAIAIAGCGPRSASYEEAREETTRESLSANWLEDVALPAYLDCTREAGATLVQAHRGGPRPGYPENALSTFERAIEDGAVFIEMDVAQTADGRLVLMHDETVDRTTTGRGEVSQMTLEDFRALRLVDETGAVMNAPPPTLDEALILLEGIAIAQIDIKDIEIEDAIAGLEEADAIDRAVLITYSLADAIAAHAANPDLMISAGLDDLEDYRRLEGADVDMSRIVAWLGLGSGEPEFDAELAARGIETSFGDFRAEAEGRANYLAWSDTGAEVLSVNDVRAATRALRAAQTARGVLATCPQARSED